MQQTQNINNTKESKKATLDNKNKASWEQKSLWLIPDMKQMKDKISMTKKKTKLSFNMLWLIS